MGFEQAAVACPADGVSGLHPGADAGLGLSFGEHHMDLEAVRSKFAERSLNGLCDWARRGLGDEAQRTRLVLTQGPEAVDVAADARNQALDFVFLCHAWTHLRS